MPTASPVYIRRTLTVWVKLKEKIWARCRGNFTTETSAGAWEWHESLHYRLRSGWQYFCRAPGPGGRSGGLRLRCRKRARGGHLQKWAPAVGSRGFYGKGYRLERTGTIASLRLRYRCH